MSIKIEENENAEEISKVDEDAKVQEVDSIPQKFDESSIAEDARANTPKLITKYGYHSEVHYVTTEDGYILRLHRIAGGPKSPRRKSPPKKVCFLMHGVLDSSAAWVMTGPNKALGFILADEGYDVWLGNSRGNLYSAKHTIYSPYSIFPKKREQYWSFSWHEIGFFDLPASIDYILSKTGQTKLQYIAHSQGTTAFFVMCSERPEYNEKIEMMHAIAPVAFLSHVVSPPIHTLMLVLPILKKTASLLGVYFLPPTTCFWPFVGFSPIQLVIKYTLLATMGYKSDQVHSAPMQLFLGHTPAGCSTKQFYHFAQLIKTGRFIKYDPNFLTNTDNDDNITSSDYNLKNVLTRVALYYSDEDWLAVDADIQRLKGELPNVVKDFPIHHKRFNHLDFILGDDAPRLLYSEILKTIKKSELMSSAKVPVVPDRINLTVTVSLTLVVVFLPFLLYYFLYGTNSLKHYYHRTL